jgi:hypothetical protein
VFFLNEEIIKDLRICIFDWSRTTRIYHIENMGVKVRNSVFVGVLHYTVNVGIISYLVIYITEQKYIMKSFKILQSQYG